MHLSLRNLDLNLLLVFDALYRHGSVTAAAEELSLSPSAFSHALNRLRHTLSDPLFTRIGGKMIPTVRSSGIAPGVATALQRLAESLREEPAFDPLSSSQTFTFAATDYTAATVLPDLIARVNLLAPGIKISVRYSHDSGAKQELISGRTDFSLGFEEDVTNLPHGLSAIDCFTDDYAVAARKGHQRIGDILTREQYLACGHIVVRPWYESYGAVDRHLASVQAKRRIVVELPSLMIAPLIAAGTDLLITLPMRGIKSIFSMSRLDVFPPPFPTPRYTLKAYFSPARCNTPGHIWMMEQIRAVTADQN